MLKSLSIKLLFLTLLIVIFHSCSNDSKSFQELTEYGIKINCPCKLNRDTLMEAEMNERIKDGHVAFSCVDKNNDAYKLDILFDRERIYTNDQILNAIDSTLNAKNIWHERRAFKNKDAIIIDYQNAKEIEILGENYSYYFVLIANDSLNEKFDRCINSISF